MSDRPAPTARASYRHFETIATRWMDNDVYGHVNNVVHYSLFDTAVNRWLIHQSVLDIRGGEVIGLVVHTQCQYFDSIAFPQIVHVGMKVTQLGRSSVTYELSLFADDAVQSAALGHFTHVYVDRHTRRPVPLPVGLRAALVNLKDPV